MNNFLTFIISRSFFLILVLELDKDMQSSPSHGLHSTFNVKVYVRQSDNSKLYLITGLFFCFLKISFYLVLLFISADLLVCIADLLHISFQSIFS